MKQGIINGKSLEKTHGALVRMWKAFKQSPRMTKRNITSMWRGICQETHIRKIAIDDVLSYIIADTEPTIDDTKQLKQSLLEKYSKPVMVEEVPTEEAIDFGGEETLDELIPSGIPFDGKMMSSLFIAQETNKRHDSILRSIRRVLGERTPMVLVEKGYVFEESMYQDIKGQNRPMYLMNKKATLLMLSGFDALLRASIIDRWEALETGKATPIAKMDTLDFLQMQLQVMKENRDRITALEERLDAHDREVEQNRQALEHIPLAGETAAERTERSLVDEMVRRYAIVHLDKDFEEAWDNLYREYRYRYNKDLKLRARNEGYTNVLAYADRQGYMHNLYVLASSLYGNR